MMRGIPVISAILFLLLSSCASLEDAFNQGVLGGHSAIKDKNQIHLETVSFPDGDVVSAAGVPGKHSFMILRTSSSGFLLQELDVTTGQTLWSQSLPLHFQPTFKSMVADSRGRVYIFPSTLSRHQRTIAIYDSRKHRLRLKRLPLRSNWTTSPLEIARDNEDGIFYPSVLSASRRRETMHSLLVLYHLLPNGKVKGPFPVGTPPQNGNFNLTVDPATDLVWTTVAIRQRPTLTSVTTYTGTQVQTETKLNILPLSFIDGPGLAVLNTQGLLLERIPVGNAAGWIRSVFPLTGDHSVRIAGETPTCFTEIHILDGTWEGFVVLSMVNVGIPAIDTIAGNPKGTIAVGQMAFKIFLKTFGPDAAKEALSSREALKIFLAKKENRAKQKLLIRALKTMVTHPPASLTGGIKSSSVHSVCETNNPIFSNPLQISDQDWWTLTSNGTAPQLTHVFFPNTSLLSIFQGPMVKSLYPLTSLRLEYSRLVQNPSGDVMVVEASQVVLVRNTDMEAKGTS